MNTQEIISHLKSGQIAVIPTDTLYGIVGIASNPNTIDRIYELKHRDPSKASIVLISDVSQLEQFGISNLPDLSQYWPGPFSILLSCPDPDFAYIHKGTEEIAFRLPDNQQLRDIISQTGPLVAPSANIEGNPPATTIEEAKAYFGDNVEYLDGGILTGNPSSLLRIHEDGTIDQLR